jgi:hypothetical protein
MTEHSKFTANGLLFAVIIALLLQPVGAIDFSNQNSSVLAEGAEISSTGARTAQTEWVASAVQASGANSQNPNLVFPSDVLVDSNDNVIAVGNMVADITFGNQGASTTHQLGFVALANSQGAWQWVETLGTYDGGGYSGVTAVTQVTSDYYLCGWFQGNITFGNQNYRSTQDSQDIFVSKISSQGVFDWTITAGGPLTDTCEDITSTSSGDVFAAGSFNTSANFQSTGKVSQGGMDGWFAQINTGQVTTGNRWSWVTTVGGSADDYGSSVQSNGNNVFGCGWFQGTATFGTNQVQAIGQLDSYITTLSMTGGVVDTAQAGATGGIVQIMDIAEDAGTIYATGQLIGTANFGTNQVSSSNAGQDRTVVVAALSSSNNLWSWATVASGAYQMSTGIAMTGGGGLVIAGQFATLNAAGTQMEPTGSGSFGSTTLSAKYLEGFIAGLSSSGAWAWAEATDGDYFDSAMAVGVMSTGTIVSMGDFGGGGVTSGSSYTLTLGGSQVSGTGNYYTENGGYEVGLWVWAVGADSDGDGTADGDDNCPMDANADQSDIDYDYIGDVCDDDIDGDGKFNGYDNCNGPEVNWDNTDPGLDMDQDGCLDSTEDLDDDGDGIADVTDPCTGPNFKLQWSSNSANDHDSDGCHDSEEDPDDDNDGVNDVDDDCLRGWHNWTADSTTDHDSDGCKDGGEDDDDDNDGVNDRDAMNSLLDMCPTGDIGWTSDENNDRDGDGCRDATEDNDDDGDEVADNVDNCSPGPNGWALHWTSVPSTDLDGDGCRDLDEDDDDDGDTIPDSNDACPRGMTGWISDSISDMDGDGCRDADEDTDDDGDGFQDVDDNCPNGETDWVSTPENDWDRDGCRDETEDDDDDQDTVSDSVDQCPHTPLGEDIDITGCGWFTQQDTDADGVWDHLDNCQSTPNSLIRETFNDSHGFEVDDIGCWPGESDDDDDGKLLYIDDCPNTPAEYKAMTSVDGCHVSEYDIDMDGVAGDLVSPFGSDQCTATSDEMTRTNNSGFGVVDAFGCWNGDSDTDGDGVRLYLDMCPDTPTGESVLAAGPELVGCSDSQRDEDADGVMSDIDACLETPAKEDVQTEGEYAGCSLDERVSKGDTSAVLQKNLLWIIIGSLVFIGLAVMLTLMVLRRKEQAPIVSGSFEQSMVAPAGFAQAPAVAAAPQVAADYTQLPGGGSYSTGAMGETIYNAPDGSNWQMQADSSFIRIN